MSISDLERIEAELKAIRKLVEARGDHTTTERMAVSVAEAAEMLLCSTRHVQRLIHTGQLLTTPLGSKRMVRIPMSEIRRITTPAMPEFGQAPTTPAVRRRYSPAMAEAEYLKLRGRGKPTKRPKR